jgi:hypothetical protein
LHELKHLLHPTRRHSVCLARVEKRRGACCGE